MKESLALFLRIYLKLALLAIAVGTAVRIVLLFNEQTSDLDFAPGEWLQIFLLGAVNDLCALTVGFFFLWLFAMSLSEGKYRKPWGYLILAVLTGLFLYVSCFHTIFDEYGSVVPAIASALTGYWAAGFALRLFCKGFRRRWTAVWFAVLLACYVGGIVFNAVGE